MGLGLSNPTHLLFVAVILLLVFGAKRLPEMGRSLGSGMRGFKDALTGEDAETPGELTAPTPAAATPVTATASVATAAEPVAHEAQAPQSAL